MAEKRINHTPTGPRELDCRQASARRCYFRCLLNNDAIWSKGMIEMPSDMSAAFYKLVLKSPHAVGACLRRKRTERLPS